MSDDKDRNRGGWGLVEQSRELCSVARATVASAKAALARSKQRRLDFEERIVSADQALLSNGGNKRR